MIDGSVQALVRRADDALLRSERQLSPRRDREASLPRASEQTLLRDRPGLISGSASTLREARASLSPRSVGQPQQGSARELWPFGSTAAASSAAVVSGRALASMSPKDHRSGAALRIRSRECTSSRAGFDGMHGAADAGCAGGGGSLALATAGSLRVPSRERAGVEADCPGPWLRAWVEFQVDARINQAFRDLAEGELAAAFSKARRESAAASEAVALQADQARERLEGEVGAVAQKQAKLFSVVEEISGKVERFSSVVADNRDVEKISKAEGAIEDLRQLHDGEVQRRQSALADLRHLQAEASVEQRRLGADLADTREGVVGTQQEVAELSRVLQSLEQRLCDLNHEASARHHQASDKLAGALDVLAGTQREVGDLAQAVDRLERRLTDWQAEVAQRAEAEIRSAVADQSSEVSAEVMRIEAELRAELRAELERGALDLSAAVEKQARTESRFERFDSDLTTALKARGSLETRFEELRVDLASAAVRREDFERGHQELRTELATAVAARDGLERRLEELRAELAAAASREGLESPGDALPDLRRRAAQRPAERGALVRGHGSAGSVVPSTPQLVPLREPH